LPLPPAAERAVYVVDGAVTLDGEPMPPQTLAVLSPGDEPLLAADGTARVVLIGDEVPPQQPAAAEWATWADRTDLAGTAGPRFAPVPGETGFIPAPPLRPRG
jgi:redox-sensitive bicupin YhaK (pirin superfamily)